jgi:uncharacterized protein (TIGR02145 family)
MKKLFIPLLIIPICTILAQAPDNMSYQAIIRNANSELIVNDYIGIKISILQGSKTGTSLYTETFHTLTNSNGLISIEIGRGTVITGTFASINWGTGPYFLKTEVDPDGGSNYNITGTSQILSVPYALYSKTAENGFSGEFDDLVNKPTSISGYGITDFDFTGVTTNDLLKFNGTKWVKFSPNYLITEVDGSVTNEIQTLTLNSDQLTISGAGGNTVTFTNWDKDYTNDVRVIGDQNIDGNKTFIGEINVPEPVDSSDAVTKKYVDGFMKVLSAKGLIVLDCEGNVYSTVRIGSQIWMAEDLKTHHYNDCDAIPIVNSANWASQTTAACLETYLANYYNWYVVETNKICPAGWHVPSDGEWTVLSNYLGGNAVAGGKMKTLGGWCCGNTDANNESGFTGTSSGCITWTGSIDEMTGYVVHHWTSTVYSADNAYITFLYGGSGALGRSNEKKRSGNCIRCIKD